MTQQIFSPVGLTFNPPLVFTSSNGGHTDSQLAEMAINKIIYVNSKTVAPEILAQANAFKAKIYDAVLFAVKSARMNAFVDFIADAEKLGQHEVAKLLRERLTNGDY